jgi:hypothetical protein
VIAASPDRVTSLVLPDVHVVCTVVHISTTGTHPEEHQMATTTQITNIAAKLDLTAYAGDFVADFDMDAVHADYVQLLNDDLAAAGYRSVQILTNGDVIAELDEADKARDIDWDDLTNERVVEDIFERHDVTKLNAPSVNLLSAERAEWLANLSDFRANGISLVTRGSAVELTNDALERLADLDEDSDGHFDGTHIWVGGTEYAVTR